MIVRACEEFGFVPTILLTDNMKTVMDKANISFNKGGIQNIKAREFAHTLGTTIIAGTKHRPETKSIVEVQMKSLDQLKLNKGTATLEHVACELKFLDKCFNKEAKDALIQTKNGLSTIIPNRDIFEDREIARKLNLPKITQEIKDRYIIKGVIRKADLRLLIKYDRINYSLPKAYKNKNVRLIAVNGYLLIYDIITDILITAHKITYEKPYIYYEDHYLETYGSKYQELDTIDDLPHISFDSNVKIIRRNITYGNNDQ